ncbi:MAG: peptide deformylase [Saprospiraceae bacterium]|nr:peptide deformylase [Saprospiraceae bacterium]
MIKRLAFLSIVSLLLASCLNRKITTQNINTFSQKQRMLISKGDQYQPMRILKITNHKDSLVLRRKSTDVQLSGSDPALELFLSRLYMTVTDSMSLGVGIAAPQVGVLKNIIWVQRFDKEGFPFEPYINPKILQYSMLKQDCLEGCLSIPDRRDTTNNRAYAILLAYDRPDATNHVEMVEDFTAVIFQHEIDHLKGILYLDHLQEEIRNARN